MVHINGLLYRNRELIIKMSCVIIYNNVFFFELLLGIFRINCLAVSCGLFYSISVLDLVYYLCGSLGKPIVSHCG